MHHRFDEGSEDEDDEDDHDDHDEDDDDGEFEGYEQVMDSDDMNDLIAGEMVEANEVEDDHVDDEEDPAFAPVDFSSLEEGMHEPFAWEDFGGYGDGGGEGGSEDDDNQGNEEIGRIQEDEELVREFNTLSTRARQK